MSRRRGKKKITLAKAERAKTVPLRATPAAELEPTWQARMRARVESEIADAAKKSGRFERPAAEANYVRTNPNEPEIVARFEARPAHLPLVKAFYCGKIDPAQFNAGNTYRVLYEKAHDTRGRDSTQIEHIDRGRNTDGAGLSAAERDSAKKALARIDGKLGLVDAIIVRNFCGIGVTASTAVKAATICRSSTSTWDRLNESLTALQRALSGEQKASAPIRGGDAKAVKSPQETREGQGWRTRHRSFAGL